MTPTMHEPFDINQRVHFRFYEEGGPRGTGTIIGIASAHVIFHYIVLLDEPLAVDGYRDWRAISVAGTLLKKI